ncbi:MAG: hypothetical protein GAK29_02583 [Acinetobacter bereziniae]|uniref:Phage tail fibre protein N-terminal domain-containing protein n=1 Tax=Acinetobacter bereziniae TaxID=106648 RepID=A0A833UC36_ACIBZ|nr:MAG: hypothetical protein GAK29_02583 [Acinetobacter bereziniae]
MANTYKGILTNNGKALIANATVNNKINYSHIAVGDGNGSVPTPSEIRPALINEKARIALNVVEINPNNTNQIVCQAIIPTNVGGFYIRELGLYAGATMVVNASYPPTYKPLADEGGAREIAIEIVINIQNAEVIALYLDDSLIYATREWVNNNYIKRTEIVDNLTTDDATKPLSAKQGKFLNDKKLNKDTEQSALTTDKGFLDKYASRNTPSFFFDSGSGKFFSQYTAGVASSLDEGAYFILGASPLDNKVKVMSGTRRENGTYDLQKNLTLLDSESNNVVNGDFVWDNHKNGGWARGLVFKAKADSNVYSGFGAFGNTDTVENVYFGFGGENLCVQGNGKGIWIDQNGAYSNCKWTFNDWVTGSFTGTFEGSIQAKDIRNVSPNQIKGGKMGYYFAEYSGIRYGTVSGATYGDFLALNAYNDASGGKLNGLFFDKTSHQIYHFQNTFGANNWGTPRQIAYTDNQTFTGSNKFTGDIQVDGPIYAQKFRGDSDFWFTSKDETKAKRLLTGGLLISDSYSEASKIPNLGLYAKGHIYTSSDVCADTYRGYAGTAKYIGNLDGKLLNARMINGVAFDASQNIDIPQVSFYIPAGANLNNYQTTGFYFQDTDGGAQQIANVPQANAFALRVEKSAGCSQWFTPYNGNGKTYYRHFYSGGWSNWVLLLSGLGVDQNWIDMSSSRTRDTVYTNNTGKPIQVSIAIPTNSGYNANLYCDNQIVSEWLQQSNGSFSLSAIIPNGSNYKLTTNYSGAPFRWWKELR